METVISGGASRGAATILYDATASRGGIRKVQSALANYRTSTEQLSVTFNRVLEELKGETAQSFKSTAQDYIQTAQMAEEYLQVFIDLMYLVDDQLSQSEQESQHMMNRISL
ncbi:hypothetical protein [Numidum massiliense]|uniref:hypothetical protein n=1 Tax=Numidum massiliense TaxID=1522315 RepID=UPI0006D57913|nr:hypothetical protein [Numidum massiliense]